jgi:uncharacterized protein YifN (PemK superfamily)
MAINFHPAIGTILICDFGMLRTPEITKRRPVIVISPNLKNRNNICTVVPLSKSPPTKIMPYHHKLFFEPLLPEPYTNPFSWVLGDMIYTVGFERLKCMTLGKDQNGKRIIDNRVLAKGDLKCVQKCVLAGLSLPIDF